MLSFSKKCACSARKITSVVGLRTDPFILGAMVGSCSDRTRTVHDFWAGFSHIWNVTFCQAQNLVMLCALHLTFHVLRLSNINVTVPLRFASHRSIRGTGSFYALSTFFPESGCEGFFREKRWDTATARVSWCYCTCVYCILFRYSLHCSYAQSHQTFPLFTYLHCFRDIRRLVQWTKGL